MPDYDRLLSQQRNTLLNPEFTTRDAIRAGVQSTTGTPYAANRANITAEKYNRALGGYQVLSNERDYEAQQDQQMWQRAQAEADRGDENFKRLLDLSGAYGANEADSQRLAAWAIQQAEERNIDDPNQVPSLVAEGAEALGLPARPELTLMSTAGGGVTGIDPLGGTRTIVEGESAAPKPYTDVGKVNADLTSGLITPAQALQEAQRLNSDEGETWRPMSAEERTQYGIPEGRASQISSSGKAVVIGSSGGGVTIYGPDGNPIAQIGGDLPLTGSQRGSLARDTADSLNKTNENLAELESAMRTLQEGGPDAVAISGAVTRNLGGVINQMSNFFNQGDWIDTEDAQRVKSELGALFGRYIPTITAEEGGRYTEGDVARAAGVLPANQRAEDIVAGSFGRIVTALETLWDIERRASIRDRMKIDGHPAGLDLTYEFGRQQEVSRLMRQGMSIEEASNQVFDLVEKYAIPIDLRGLPDSR